MSQWLKLLARIDGDPNKSITTPILSNCAKVGCSVCILLKKTSRYHLLSSLSSRWTLLKWLRRSPLTQNPPSNNLRSLFRRRMRAKPKKAMSQILLVLASVTMYSINSRLRAMPWRTTTKCPPIRDQRCIKSGNVDERIEIIVALLCIPSMFAKSFCVCRKFSERISVKNDA